jgi:hypothetical protein
MFSRNTRVNTRERSGEIVSDMTIPRLYSRVQIAMTMARSEQTAIRGWLEQRKQRLAAEIEEIDALLAKGFPETDSWYETISVEREIAHEREHATSGTV